MRITASSKNPLDGLTLPAPQEPIFNLAKEGFEPHQYMSAIVQRRLSEDLLALGDAALPQSDRLCLAERAGSPTARRQLRELQMSLRKLAALMGEISWGAQIFEQFAQERPLEDFVVFPRVQSCLLHRPASALGMLIDQEMMRSLAPRATGFRSEYSLVADTPLAGLKEYATLREQLLQQCDRAHRAAPSGETSRYQTQRLSGIFSMEVATTLKNLMMQYHRAPGDPEISRHGVVISRITNELLNNDVHAGCQILLTLKDQRVVGVSQFFLPTSYPDFALPLAKAFPSDRKAYLLMMLVDPAERGSVIFPMQMSALQLLLQASSCDHILGEVEYTNLRAMRAYARYGGRIHPELRFPHQTPSGAMTEFLGLSIPLAREDPN